MARTFQPKQLAYITVLPSSHDAHKKDSLKTAFVFLYLSLAAGAALRDEFGQVLALSFHSHSFIESTIIHPLGHVATAGRIVGLQKVQHISCVEPPPLQRRQYNLFRALTEPYFGKVAVEARDPRAL